MKITWIITISLSLLGLPAVGSAGYVMDDSNIRTAVAAWLSDAAAAEATYGHISTSRSSSPRRFPLRTFPLSSHSFMLTE